MPLPRILLLSEIFPPRIGGSGRWLWELHRRLNGFDIHVVAGDTPGADAFDASAELPINRLPMDFLDWGLLEPRGGLKYVRYVFSGSSGSSIGSDPMSFIAAGVCRKVCSRS